MLLWRDIEISILRHCWSSSGPWSCIRCRLWHCSGSGLANQGQHCDSGGPHPGHALPLPLHQNQAPRPDRRGNQGYSAFSFQLKMCLTNVNNLKIISRVSIKGTQDWDFFWLWFWNLYYFLISYVKTLRFYKKKIYDQAIFEGDTIFTLSLRLSGIEFSLVWD